MDKAAAIDGQAAGAAEPARWRLRLAGLPQLLPPQGPALALDRHAALIAARLVLAGPQPRELLARLLWPDVEASRARGNLRQRLLRLKALAGFDWIHGEAVLSLAPNVQPLLPQGGAEDDAELLAGIRAEDSEELGAWLEQVRAEHRARQLKRLLGLAAEAEAGHRLDDALAAAQRLLALEPHAETHHRLVIRLHYQGHDMAAARAAYERLRAMLRREYGAEPSAATRELLALIERAAQPVSRGVEAPAVMAAAPMAGPSAAQAAALMRPPRRVGRDAEAAALLARLGERGTVLLFGEGGLGKSRLLADVGTTPQARALGWLAVGARPGDAGLPYALAARWLRALLQRRGSPPPQALQPALAAVLPEFGPAGGGDASRLALAAATLVREAAATGLRAHAIDDLQYADAASVELLQGVINAADDPGTPSPDGCGWLLSMRPGELGPAAQALVQALEADVRTLRLRLQPLDRAEVQALLEVLALDGIGGERDAQALHQRTGGNPLFLLETLKARLAAERTPRPGGPAWPLADSVTRLIQARLARLSPLALKAARCAALAGADLGVPLVAKVLNLQPLDLADAWAELKSAQVLGEDGRFAHDLIAEAARDSVPAAVAQPLHAAIAGWLEQHDGEPVRVAEHWLAAALPRRAVPHLHRAGRQASELGRMAEASRWHEQAAAIQLEAGDRRGAFEGYFLAADNCGEIDDVETARRCAEVLRGLVEDEGQQAMLACVEAYLLIEAGNRHEETRQVALLALPKAQRAGLADIEVELLWTLVAVNHEAQRMAEALGYAEQALQRLDAVDPATARVSLSDTRLTLVMAIGHLAMALGRGVMAQAQLAEGRRLATQARLFDKVAWAERALAMNALDTGDAAAALQWAKQSVASLAAYQASPSDRARSLLVHSVALTAGADLGGALQAVELASQASLSASIRYRHGCAMQMNLLRFELGRPDQARQGLRLQADNEALSPAERAMIDAALLAVGEPADGEAVLASARSTDDRVERARLLCLAQPGIEPARILPLLAEAADAALARGSTGLWMDLQTARLAALRAAGADASERRALALQVWPRLEAGAIGRRLFPWVAGELCQALAGAGPGEGDGSQAALAQVIAMQASAWMLRAASTLEPTPRRIYLTQAPVLKLFGRGLLALPGA